MDRRFYRRVFALMLPILLQNGITNLAGVLDNVMVGSLGTAETGGVFVANQLVFVFALCIFGVVSGAGIFGAQFAGSGDKEGLRYSFRYKLISCTAIAAIGTAVFAFFGEELIALFLRGEGDPAVAAQSLSHAKDYLYIVSTTMIPFAWTQCYSSTLRETGKATPPMAAGVASVAVNLALNWILIFGKFGLPALGVAGAAIATCVSRIVEFLAVSLYTARKKNGVAFIEGAFDSLRVPKALVLKITSKGLPLMLNETMWAAGMTAVTRFYTVRSLDVVSANNINQTFANVFSVVFFAIGVSAGIILGQMIGAGETSEARVAARKLIRLSVIISVVVAAAFALASNVIPGFYNTTEEVRSLAGKLMIVCAFAMPLDAFANAAYFTLRSGGHAMITIIFDSGFVWAVSVPAAVILAEFTSVDVVRMYAIVQGLNVLKVVVGFIFVHRGKWATNIVSENSGGDHAGARSNE